MPTMGRPRDIKSIKKVRDYRTREIPLSYREIAKLMNSSVSQAWLWDHYTINDDEPVDN